MCWFCLRLFYFSTILTQFCPFFYYLLCKYIKVIDFFFFFNGQLFTVFFELFSFTQRHPFILGPSIRILRKFRGIFLFVMDSLTLNFRKIVYFFLPNKQLLFHLDKKLGVNIGHNPSEKDKE